jgi:PKD repeat protein
VNTTAVRKALALGVLALVASVACTTQSGSSGPPPPPPNQDPIGAFTINPGAGSAPLTVTLDGSFSTDPDGSIATYSWDLGDGHTATTPTVTHQYAAGTFTATLTVTDDQGATDVVSHNLTVAPSAPIASLVASPTTGPAPLTVHFDGSASSDPDGTILTYDWDFGDGSAHATTATVDHTYAVGTFTAKLKVTDVDGLSDTKTVLIGGTNDAPVASFTTTPSSGNAPLTVSFNASGSHDDGVITSYQWTFGDGGTGTGVTPAHVFGVGTFTVTLTVTDNNGVSTSVTHQVTGNNVPPVAAFTVSPSSGAAPLTVTLDASSSTDATGTIASYSWDFDTAWAFAGDTASGKTVTHTYTPGVYTAKVTVTDSYGASSSTTRTVTVSGTPAAPSGLHLTGSGCCNTYGDFAWNPVPGADAYNVQMITHFGGGCLVDESAVTNGQTDHGRVQAALLCLGTQYDISIQAHANGVWGPWSSSTRISL